MKYYSTQHPIVPGSYPELGENHVVEICNYDSKTYCEEIDREAWGYIEFEHPLQPEDAIDFDLIPPPRKVKPVKCVGIDSWSRMVFQDENGKLWKYTAPGETPMEMHERLYSSTNNDFDGEPCWPMLPDVDYRIEIDSRNSK